MINVIFQYNGMDVKIQSNENEKMEEICQKFCTKMEKEINNICFFYSGKQINFQLKFNEVSKGLKDIIILAYDISTYHKEINVSSFIKSKEIICPECEEICLIKIKDYKITLNGCKNGHKIKDMSLEAFKNSQLIDESFIRCFKCNKSKNKTYNKQFFICLTCKKNLCPLCNSNHDKNHKIIDYNKKNYICNIHNDTFVTYCKKCRNNLCMLCEKNHDKNHHKVKYKNLIEDEDKIKEKVKIFKTKIENIKDKITNIVDILNKLKDEIDIYYEINNDLINNYNIQNKNYEYLKNLSEIENIINSDEFETLNKEKDIKRQFPILINIHNKMNYKNSSITINPPKECFMYQDIFNLNNEFNELEKEIKAESNSLMENINELKKKLCNIENAKEIKFEGGTYYGQAIENDFNGVGIIEYDDGDKYEGEFKNDKRDGLAIYTGYNRIYYGNCKNNERSGFGILINKYEPNGERYEGEWTSDDKTGTGLWFHEDGTIYIGSLLNGKSNGNGKLVFSNGDYFIGEIKNNKRIQGKAYYSEEKGIFDAKWEYNDITKETIAKGIFYCSNGTNQERTRIINDKESFWKYE